MTSTARNRRTFTSITALTVATLAAPALWAQPRLERSKISIAMEGKAVFAHLPLTIAEQLGYFKAEGVEVKLSSFEEGSRSLRAVVAESVDLVSGAYEHIIGLQSSGKRYQAFVMQGRAPAIAVGISTKTMPRYRSVADLKGKKIGISTPDSSTHLVASLLLSRAGLKPVDVNFIAVGKSAGAMSAFRSGHIDAISNVEPVMTMLEQRGEIRIIADTRTLKGTVDVFGGPMPAGCLYAPAEFIQKNPRTVQALTFAMTRALKWLQTAGPSDIIKVIPEKYVLGDRALYLSAFNKVREVFSPDGLIPDEGPRTALRAMVGFDSTIKADKIELGKTYSNQFVKKAKERFNA